jgi:hypothetical protein
MSGASPNEVQNFVNQKFGVNAPLAQVPSEAGTLAGIPVMQSSTNVPITQGETFLKPYETTAAKQAMTETSGGKGAGAPIAQQSNRPTGNAYEMNT